MSADVSTTGIVFEDCIVGVKYSKDFNLVNKSEIDLFWKINIQDIPSCISIVDIESGKPLLSGVIASYSTRRIRFSCVPTEVGEFDYDLLFENINDSSNTLQIHIHSLTRESSRNESLVISSHNLDFGDCCAGIMKKHRMVLKNVGDTPLEISFGSDKPQDVYFQILNDDDNGALPTDYTKSEISTNEYDNFSSGIASESDIVSDNESADLSGSDRDWVHERETSTVSLQSNSSASSVDSQPNRLELEMFLSKTLKSTLSRTNARDAESTARIEEIILRPGSERVVEVCYIHPRDIGVTEGKLTKQLFKLFLLYSVPGVAKTSDKATIQCVSRVCTSVVKLSTNFVDFGNSDVGTVKQSSIEILNNSDLPAIVKLKYESKVLTSIKNEIIIPARQKTSVKIDFYPRKINPDYRKVITVVNVLNPDNDLTFTVHSVNFDKQRVTLHSYFYQIAAAGLTHFVDFGVVSINSTVVRAVTVENITEKELDLKLDSSIPADLKIFEIPQGPSKAVAHMSVDYKAKALKNFELGFSLSTTPDTPVKRNHKLQRTATSMRDVDKAVGASEKKVKSNTDYLDLAISNEKSDPNLRKRAKSIKAERRDVNFAESDSSESVPLKQQNVPRFVDEPSNFSGLSLTEFLALAERESGLGFPLFANFDSEEAFVQRRRQIIKRLKSKIRSGGLVPTSFLSLRPRQKRTIYLILEVSSDLKKYSKVLSILMLGQAEENGFVHLHSNDKRRWFNIKG